MKLRGVFIYTFLCNVIYVIGAANHFGFHNRIVNPLSQGSLATLEFVALISRHGSRTPLSTYPNDPYPCNDTRFWPVGRGELTYYGKQQLFQTGQTLRARYSDFLPEIFFPNDTIAEFNNNDRDFMSAACLLAGLYPPVGVDVWNKDIQWQPVPLSSRAFDVCGLPYGNACPSYKVESNALLDKLDQNGSNNNTISKMLKYVTKFTGKNIPNLSKLYDVVDLLHMQVQNGFKVPEWAKEFYPNPLAPMVAPVILTQYGGSDFLIRMGAGPELKHVSEMFNMKVNGTYESNRKFYIEAAHDCTLIAILKALGNTDPEFQVYTSAYITFELHFLSESYIVQTRYFKNSADKKGKWLNIAGCPNPCSLDNFNKFVDSINPPNWQEACHKKPSKQSFEDRKFR